MTLTKEEVVEVLRQKRKDDREPEREKDPLSHLICPRCGYKASTEPATACQFEHPETGETIPPSTDMSEMELHWIECDGEKDLTFLEADVWWRLDADITVEQMRQVEVV